MVGGGGGGVGGGGGRHSEPVYGNNDKYTKTKTKSYGDKVNINFTF